VKYTLVFLLVACLAVGLGCAAAEEVFVIAADQIEAQRLEEEGYAAQRLTAPTQYIQITCALGDEPVPVKLRVSRSADGKTVHQKNYGQQKGDFRSEEIYLKYTGSGTAAYDITLTAGERQWQFPFYRKLMKLSRNTACSYGVRIREAAPGVTKGWPMATVVDLTRGSQRVPLCASDRYVIGEVEIQLGGDSLQVNVKPFDHIDLTVHHQKVYAITDPGTLTGLDAGAMKRQLAFSPGEKVSIRDDLAGSPYVILYLSMEVSYDPNGLDVFQYDASETNQQLNWWNRLKENSDTESLG